MDGFRALALVGVVTMHLLLASGLVGAVSHAGEVAIWAVFGNVIDGFFIISGFGIFLPVVAARGELGDVRAWAVRRGARLFPAYWLCIAVLLLLLAVAPAAERNLSFPDAREIAIHLTGLEMPAKLFNSDFAIGFGANGPLWMISVILGFYLVFPLIARPYYRHPLAGLAVAAAITVAWRESAIHAAGFWQHLEYGAAPSVVAELVVTDQLPGWAFSFALGMTAAWLYHRLKTRPDESPVERPALLLACGGLVACGICGYLYAQRAIEVDSAVAGSHARLEPLLDLAYSASRGALMAGIAVGPLWLQAPFANRPMEKVAELSYAVYLIHLPVAIWVGLIWLDLPRDGTALTVLAWFGAVFAVSFAYAAVSRRLVERPALRWSRRYARPGGAPTATPLGARPAAPP